MKIIEPCCASRHMMGLRRAVAGGRSADFEGYGDLSLAELLPAILTRYSETSLLIAAPAIPEQAAEVIAKWMRKQWARMDGKGKIDVVARLTLVTDLSLSPDVARWEWEDAPFGGRLTVTDRDQEDTVILLPDFAITGPVNMRYGEHFVATATTDPETIAALWERYGKPVAPEPAAEAAGSPEPAGETPETPGQPDTPEPRRRNGRRAKDAPVEPAASEEPAGDAAL